MRFYNSNFVQELLLTFNCNCISLFYPLHFRPHRSTTYVDAAYCYRPSIAWSVSRSVTVVSPAKTAQPIEIPFGVSTWVGPRNHVLDRVQIFPWKWAVLRCKRRPIVKSCAETANPIEILFGLWARIRPTNYVLDGVQIPHGKGQF